MKAELLTDLAAIERVEGEWRALAVEHGAAFLTPDWLRAAIGRAAGEAVPAVGVVRRSNGSLAGVMPLVHDRRRRPEVRFAAAVLGDRFGPLAAPGEEAEVAAATMRAIEAAGVVPAITLLHRVDADRSWPSAMAAAASRRLVTIEQSAADLLYIPTADLDWEEYLATRSQKFRQRVARGLEKALAKRHSYEIRESSSEAELAADFAMLMRLHDLRHADASSITAERDRAFLGDFAAAALRHGWLRLRVLEIEGEPAAAFLAWRLGARYAIYQSGFDPAWAHLSVGQLLLSNTVRAAIDEGAGEVDMLLGREAYKQRFATANRTVHTVAIVPAWSRARLLVAGEAAARTRARGLADSPRLGPALKRAARLLPTGRRA